jgi:hypothetical protein
MQKALARATAAAPKRLASFPTWSSKVFETIKSGATDGDAFSVGNAARVTSQLKRWQSLLPNVEPHYGTLGLRAAASRLCVSLWRMWRGVRAAAESAWRRARVDFAEV